MKVKALRIIASVAVIGILLFVYYFNSNHVIMIKETDRSKLQDYKFSYNANADSLDSYLYDKKFSYLSNGKYCIAIVTYKEGIAHFKEYIAADNETITFNVSKDDYFIISLPCNETILYSWNVENTMDKNVLAFMKKTRIYFNDKSIFKEIPTGEAYGRENLYFKAVGSGNIEMLIKYVHITEKSPSPYIVNFKININ